MIEIVEQQLWALPVKACHQNLSDASETLESYKLCVPGQVIICHQWKQLDWKAKFKSKNDSNNLTVVLILPTPGSTIPCNPHCELFEWLKVYTGSIHQYQSLVHIRSTHTTAINQSKRRLKSHFQMNCMERAEIIRFSSLRAYLISVEKSLCPLRLAFVTLCRRIILSTGNRTGDQES